MKGPLCLDTLINVCGACSIEACGKPEQAAHLNFDTTPAEKSTKIMILPLDKPGYC